MYVCMYVCISSIYVCAYASVCMFMYVYVCMYVCMYVCLFLRLASVSVQVHLCAHLGVPTTHCLHSKHESKQALAVCACKRCGQVTVVRAYVGVSRRKSVHVGVHGQDR